MPSKPRTMPRLKQSKPVEAEPPTPVAAIESSDWPVRPCGATPPDCDAAFFQEPASSRAAQRPALGYHRSGRVFEWRCESPGVRSPRRRCRARQSCGRGARRSDLLDGASCRSCIGPRSHVIRIETPHGTARWNGPQIQVAAVRIAHASPGFCQRLGGCRSSEELIPGALPISIALSRAGGSLAAIRATVCKAWTPTVAVIICMRGDKIDLVRLEVDDESSRRPEGGRISAPWSEYWGVVSIAPNGDRFSCPLGWRRRLRGRSALQRSIAKPVRCLSDVYAHDRCLAITARIAERKFSISRDIAPELCVDCHPLKNKRAAGQAGCSLHPRSRVARMPLKTAHEHPVRGGNRLPCSAVYGLFRSPSVTGLSLPRRPLRKLALRA